MEAKDEGTEVFDVPRKHRLAWKFGQICVFMPTSYARNTALR